MKNPFENPRYTTRIKSAHMKALSPDELTLRLEYLDAIQEWNAYQDGGDDGTIWSGKDCTCVVDEGEPGCPVHEPIERKVYGEFPF